MEKYHAKLAGLSNVEFIHVSLDADEDVAEEWAAQEKFPWLTVMKDKMERSGLDKYKTTNGVPEYHLIDGDGNTVVAGSAGSGAAMQKIAEIGKAADES